MVRSTHLWGFQNWLRSKTKPWKCPVVLGGRLVPQPPFSWKNQHSNRSTWLQYKNLNSRFGHTMQVLINVRMTHWQCPSKDGFGICYGIIPLLLFPSSVKLGLHSKSFIKAQTRRRAILFIETLWQFSDLHTIQACGWRPGNAHRRTVLGYVME